MISRIIAYFRVQLTIYIRTKVTLFTSFIFPIMMIFIFGSIQPRDYLETVIPGLVGFSIMTDALFTVTGAVARDRLVGIFGQLSLTPLTKSEWLVSVFLWHLLIGAASFVIVVGVGHYAYAATVRLDALIIAYIFFGVLLFVALGLLLGVVARSVESASLVGNIVGFPMMLLTGAFFPISLLPSYLQIAVRVLPLYYFNQGLKDIMVTPDFGEGLLFLGIMVAMSLAFFLASVRFFNWRET